MVKPPSFNNYDKFLVCKLHKALYGLKQEQMQWYEKFHQDFFQFGFFSRKYDHSLFVYSHQGVVLYALFCVDDILISGPSFTLIHNLITKIYLNFSLKKLGRPEYFLSVEVIHHD